METRIRDGSPSTASIVALQKAYNNSTPLPGTRCGVKPGFVMGLNGERIKRGSTSIQEIQESKTL